MASQMKARKQNNEKTEERPRCPKCGRELVQTVINFPPQSFNAYLCDCLPQPKGIATDIVRAREWDNEILVYTMEFIPDNDSDKPA